MSSPTRPPRTPNNNFSSAQSFDKKYTRMEGLKNQVFVRRINPAIVYPMSLAVLSGYQSPPISFLAFVLAHTVIVHQHKKNSPEHAMWRSIFASTWKITLWRLTFWVHRLYIQKQHSKVSVYRKKIKNDKKY